MTTKDTINKMEKELDEMSEKITDYGYNDEFGYYSDWKDGVSPIIKASIRTLLESFGEEIIGEDEKENRTLKQGIDYDIHKLLDFGLEIARIGGKNNLRAEQRLKVKEIISSIGK